MNEMILDLHTDDELPDLGEPFDDPLLARRLLIALAVCERKVEKLKATMAAIMGEYQSRIDFEQDKIRQIRDSLTIYIERGGDCSFPDVGTAYLQRRKPSAKVSEDETFAGWLIRQGHPEMIETDQVYRFTPGARKVANAAVAAGEVPPGCQLVPEQTSLVVKKAA